MRKYSNTNEHNDAWWFEKESGEVLLEYSEGEIAEALATRTLTVDHCLYLHKRGMSWQVEVK